MQPQHYYPDPNATIEISAQEFVLLASAATESINATMSFTRDEVKKYVNKNTGVESKNPSKKMLESGDLILISDVDATFSDENIKVSFSEKLTPNMIAANDILQRVHFRNIEKGLAVLAEDKNNEENE